MFIDGTTESSPALARTILMTVDASGGVLTYTLSLAQELTKLGTRVHLAMLGPKARPEQIAATRAIPGAILHEHAGALEWMKDPWPDVARTTAWLRDLEKQVRPDVVHLNAYAYGAAGFRAPVLIVAHGCVLSRAEALDGNADAERFAAYKESTKRGLNAAAAVIAVSEAMRAALDRHYGPLPRLAVVPSGLSIGTTTPPKKEALVVSTGRVWDRAKNVEVLARAAKDLPWPVEIAGGTAPPGVADGVSFERHEGIRDRAWLPAAEHGALLDRAAIFASPARYEPFGMSALEAGLRGCALVLGDIPSQREIWGDAATFVRTDDERALAAAIGQLARDEERRASMAAAAQFRARLYTPARTARAMNDVYETMIQSRGIPVTYVGGHAPRTL
jgi:glycosyltransferase involved in cell wall biosynthesis